MGFSAGFAAGWGAVDSAYRQKADAEQRKIDNEMRAADQAMRQESHGQQRKEWQRADEKRMAVADAVSSESQAGTSVGTNFAADRGNAAWLAQQAGNEAEMTGGTAPAAQYAATTGNEARKFATDGQAANFAAERQGDLGKVRRLADVEYRFGNTAGGMDLETKWKGLVKEGYKEGLDVLLQTGDATKAQELFDSTGKYKIPGKLQATPVMRKGADGVEMPDYDMSIVAEDGSVRPLGSAIAMRYRADGIENHRSMLANEAKGGRDERTVGTAEKAQISQAALQAAQGTHLGVQGEDMKERRKIDQQKADNDTRNTTSMITDRAASRAIAGGHLSLAREKWNDEKSGGELDRKMGTYERVLGRQLTEVEKLAMTGLSKNVKETDLDKTINDITVEYFKSKPTAPGQEVATFRESLKRSVAGAGPMLEVEARIKSLPPEQRAGAAAEAATRFRLEPQWFVDRGLPPPPKTAAAQAVAQPVAPVAARSAEIPANTQADPRAQQYVQAIGAIRQQQQALARQAATATPDQQAALSQQISDLGKHINTTIQQARQVGISVE